MRTHILPRITPFPFVYLSMYIHFYPDEKYILSCRSTIYYSLFYSPIVITVCSGITTSGITFSIIRSTLNSVS